MLGLDFIFAALSILIGLTTLVFPFVRGYGTQLFQIILFSGWLIVEKATSQLYADTHHVTVIALAAVLNVLVFWVVAIPVWALTRRRRQLVGMIGLMLFAALYVGSLFWLFPATDGP